jgi:Fur family transcriptional regulator, ferric uptake regulator
MKTLEQQCIDAGLKMTDQRRTIIKILSEADDHPSVETLYERAKAQDESISMATVYRTLNMLDQLNLVIKHDFKGTYSRFEINNDTHYHLVDVENGDVIEFHSDEIEKLKERIAKELGYELVDYTLELYGRKRKKN